MLTLVVTLRVLKIGWLMTLGVMTLVIDMPSAFVEVERQAAENEFARDMRQRLAREPAFEPALEARRVAAGGLDQRREVFGGQRRQRRIVAELGPQGRERGREQTRGGLIHSWTGGSKSRSLNVPRRQWLLAIAAP